MLYSLWSGKSIGNIMTNPLAIWMCTWLFGECSCTLLFKHKFLSSKNMTRIHLNRRRSSSVVRQLTQVRLISNMIHGRRIRKIFWCSKKPNIWIVENSEIIGLKIMEYGDLAWRSTSLLSEQAERIITAKVYVFSDSIRCQGEVMNPSAANEAWQEEQVP